VSACQRAIFLIAGGLSARKMLTAYHHLNAHCMIF